MREEFADRRPPKTTSGDILAMAAYLESESRQSGNGLVVAVALSNGGEGAISLMNPFELVQFQVLDHKGRPMSLPQKAPSLLVNVGTGESWRLDSPIPILGLQRNGQEAELEALDRRIFPFEAGDEYRITFEIDRFLKSRGGSYFQVPDGTYSVGCLLTLINATDTEESRILAAQAIEVRFSRRD